MTDQRWPRLSMRAALCASALLTGCGSSSSSGTAETASTPPPAFEGTLAYGKEVGGGVGGGAQLFALDAGGKERQLTNVEGNAAHADWSPDGKRIAFTIEHTEADKVDTEEDETYCSVAVMNADGSGLSDLAERKHGCEATPSFSPDGRRLAFVHYDPDKEVEQIAVMDVDGGNRRYIKSSALRGGVADPTFSPDGKWITLVRLYDGGRNSLYAMRPDGSEMHRLTPNRWEIGDKHDWSPDNSLITVTTLVHQERPGESANVVTVDPDGKIVTRVTRFSGGQKHAFAGSFSPDGKQIVLRLEDSDGYRLAIVDRDGRNLRPITEPSDSKASQIAWSPR